MILSDLQAAIDRIKELKGDNCQVEIYGSCDCGNKVTFDHIEQVDVRIYHPKMESGDIRIYMLQPYEHSKS